MLRLTVTLTVLCNVALAAHFLRDGSPVGLVVALVCTGLLWTRRNWALWVNQALLGCGALLWLSTAGTVLDRRVAEGRPYVRMLIILCSVALISAVTALLWAWPKVRRAWLRLEGVTK
jgi:Na+/phosphate symporter